MTTRGRQWRLFTGVALKIPAPRSRENSFPGVEPAFSVSDPRR